MSSRPLEARYIGFWSIGLMLFAASFAGAAPQNTSEWGDPNSQQSLPANERSEDIASAERVENRLRQRALGIKHYTGDGVAKDKVKAFEWFSRAADQGDGVSQFILGAMYADGEGVGESKELAYMWWGLAAAQGNEKAKAYKAAIEGNMTPAQITEAQRLTTVWRSKKR
ncbi:MAG: tetratricopeptide repeat protein [Gammaproteobacteria bacterium]